MKLSICIPTYNRINALKHQLTFLKNNHVFDRNDVEVLVANNSSTDGTDTYLNSIKNDYSNLTVINNESNLGLIGNLKKLTVSAIGEFIWFIGDDDTLKDGIVDKVIDILNGNDVNFVFLNHSMSKGTEIIVEKVYPGKGGLRKEGLNLFESVARSSYSNLGVWMYITGTIYKRTQIIKVNDILKQHMEENNFATPIGYSLYCSNGSGYILDDVYINDQCGDTSWKDSAVLVRCRDMIAVCDIIANKTVNPQQVRTLLFDCLPSPHPEITYMKYKKKFGYNNYALKWYLKYHKIALLTDIIKIAGKRLKTLFWKKS